MYNELSQSLLYQTRRKNPLLFKGLIILTTRGRGRSKKIWSECVKADMKMCSLGSINPLNREAWVLGVRHSSHLLPTQVLVTPLAVEKYTQDQVESCLFAPISLDGDTSERAIRLLRFFYPIRSAVIGLPECSQSNVLNQLIETINQMMSVVERQIFFSQTR